MGAIQMVVDEQADLRLNYVADKIQIKIIKVNTTTTAEAKSVKINTMVFRFNVQNSSSIFVWLFCTVYFNMSAQIACQFESH